MCLNPVGVDVLSNASRSRLAKRSCGIIWTQTSQSFYPLTNLKKENKKSNLNEDFSCLVKVFSSYFLTSGARLIRIFDAPVQVSEPVPQVPVPESMSVYHYSTFKVADVDQSLYSQTR